MAPKTRSQSRLSRQSTKKHTEQPKKSKPMELSIQIKKEQTLVKVEQPSHDEAQKGKLSPLAVNTEQNTIKKAKKKQEEPTGKKTSVKTRASKNKRKKDDSNDGLNPKDDGCQSDHPEPESQGFWLCKRQIGRAHV